MRHILILIVFFTVLMGCNKQEHDLDDLGMSLVKAEQFMNKQDLIVATATSLNNNIVKFRIVVDERLSNEQAKELVTEFIETIEDGILNKQLFKETYQIFFDIISGQTGVIFSGQRNKGEEDIWWQF